MNQTNSKFLPPANASRPGFKTPAEVRSHRIACPSNSWWTELAPGAHSFLFSGPLGTPCNPVKLWALPWGGGPHSSPWERGKLCLTFSRGALGSTQGWSGGLPGRLSRASAGARLSPRWALVPTHQRVLCPSHKRGGSSPQLPTPRQGSGKPCAQRGFGMWTQNFQPFIHLSCRSISQMC